jgi:hypothetical protein
LNKGSNRVPESFAIRRYFDKPAFIPAGKLRMTIVMVSLSNHQSTVCVEKQVPVYLLPRIEHALSFEDILHWDKRRDVVTEIAKLLTENVSAAGQ